MKRSTRILAGLGAGGTAVTLAVTGLAAPASAHPGQSAIGLTSVGTKLVSFRLTNPDNLRTIGAVSGLVGDTKLVGIDYRVQDGKLYGVGNAGGVYILSTGTAAATKVSQLSVALSGANFGVDFNPAADRLRIVSDTGQNLRHDVNPAGVTLTDIALTYPPATTTTTGVSAAAYTNNDLDPNTATTLFDLDTTLDQVAIQAPANSGQLSPTGKLTVDAGSDAGFDIYTEQSGGTSTGQRGYAALRVANVFGLYSVSLLSGAVSPIGTFGSGSRVTDIAVPLG